MDAVYRIDLREYLARGVGALVSARAEHWVFGHCGAALLAGVWLLREGRLTPPSAERLARRLEETVSADPNRYRLPEPRAPGCLDLLIEDLHENIATLRNSAHGTIYIAAALQALSEQPRLATAQTIESLRHVYRNAQTPDPDRYFDIENHAEVKRCGDRSISVSDVHRSRVPNPVPKRTSVPKNGRPRVQRMPNTGRRVRTLGTTSSLRRRSQRYSRRCPEHSETKSIRR